jgi:HK97 family phage prohead protease
MLTRDFPLKVKALGDSGAFTGYASSYGQPADLVGDVVEPGAFKQAILQQGLGYPLLWAHLQAEPIGIAKVSDSKDGLVVDGSLLLEDPAAARAYAHLKAGSIKGLSIGYSLPRGEGKVSYADDGTRTLKEVRLHEISLVAIPANPRAQITSVKSLQDVQRVLATMRDATEPEVLSQLHGVNLELKRLLRCDGPDSEDAIREQNEEELAALKILALELAKFTIQQC